jgi:hypothetical protein
MGMGMKPFEARYDGRCQACNERIYAGDMCTFDDDRIVHADCERTQFRDPFTIERQPCPKCFTVPPVSGVCGCDE